MKVTYKCVHDSKMLPKLVEGTKKSNHISIGKVFAADGAYDSNDIFRCLTDNGIMPCIKVRKNAKVKKSNHILRNLSVISQKKNSLQRWWKDRIVSYGKR